MNKVKVRITIFLLFFSFLSLSTEGQSVYKSVYSQLGTWNVNTRKWEYDSPVFVEITFIVQNHVILVGNVAQSTYTTSTQIVNIEDKDPKQFGWDAVDDKLRKCIFLSEFYDNGDQYFRFIYDDISLVYKLSSGSILDKF